MYLRFHNGPLHGERYEVWPETAEHPWPLTLWLPHPQRAGVAVRYTLLRGHDGPYYAYAFEARDAD